MRKLKFSITVFIAIVIGGCSDSLNDISEPISLKSIHNTFHSNDSEYYSDEFDFITLDDNSVIFISKYEMFRVQRRSTDQTDISLASGETEIIHFGRSMLVKSRDNDKIHYFTFGKDEDGFYDVVFSKIDENALSVHPAFGIMHSFNKGNHSKQERVLMYRKVSNNSGKFLQECHSGGPGATHCSQSTAAGECEVDCSGLYYACCNPGDPVETDPPSCTCEEKSIGS